MKHKIKIDNISIFTRFKLAWNAFWLKDFELYFPYRYGGELSGDEVCDNHRRRSKCKSKARVWLHNPYYIMQLKEANDYYHVCRDCAKKSIGKIFPESNIKPLKSAA